MTLTTTKSQHNHYIAITKHNTNHYKTSEHNYKTNTVHCNTTTKPLTQSVQNNYNSYA